MSIDYNPRLLKKWALDEVKRPDDVKKDARFAVSILLMFGIPMIIAGVYGVELYFKYVRYRIPPKMRLHKRIAYTLLAPMLTSSAVGAVLERFWTPRLNVYYKKAEKSLGFAEKLRKFRKDRQDYWENRRREIRMAK